MAGLTGVIRRIWSNFWHRVTNSWSGLWTSVGRGWSGFWALAVTREFWVNVTLGSNFFLVLLVFLAGSFSQWKIDKCLVENHPVKVLLLFSLVLGVIWATDMLVQSDQLHRHLAYGAILTLLIWTAIIVLIVNEHMGWWSVIGHDNLVMVVAFFFILGRVFKGLIKKKTDLADDETGMSAQSLKQWGDVVALAIMMLAMFFLALEFKETGFRVKWEEIPAILMVFLLAELGVALVVTASKIRLKVTAAADIAKNVVERAEKVQGALKENQESLLAAKDVLARVEEGANETMGQLKLTAKALAELAQMEMLTTSAPEFCRLAEIDRNSFWTRLNQFTTDWTPKVSDDEKERNHGLVGVLFNTFIGGDTSGTVRRTENAVSCVTVDSVFADASAQWLRAMARVESQEHQKLKVWAVTSLLPTDFALPQVWWGDTGIGSRGDVIPRRTRTLERFIDSVIGECKTGHAVGEYRRVTVFPNGDKFMPSPEGGTTWLDDFGYSLDNWFLWDPRVQTTSEPRLYLNHVQYCSTALANSIWSQLTSNGEKLAKPNTDVRKLSWSALQGLYVASVPEGSDAGMEKRKEARTLPPLNGPDASVLYFFNCDFGLQQDGQPLTGGVIGAKDIFLDYQVDVADLAKFGCEAGFLEVIKRGTKRTNLTVREIYRLIGWSSLRDWYCDFLHRGMIATDDGAWWAVLKESDVALDPLLEPFKLTWDDYKVVTLDLLLIGPLDGHSGNGNRDWYGAAISNISFDRTECTVQLVTNQRVLAEIAQAVEGLCANFSDAKSDKVKSHGRWKNWPTGFDKTELKSKPASAK